MKDERLRIIVATHKAESLFEKHFSVFHQPRQGILHYYIDVGCFLSGLYKICMKNEAREGLIFLCLRDPDAVGVDGIAIDDRIAGQDAI